MAKKGSHLKRFKESLSRITKPDHRKKIRKSVPDRDPDRAEKLKHIEEQFNAFDTKFTRSKHEVFGRKVKGKKGKPGESRERAEQERKNALIKERVRRNRAGGLIDRRFGENDPDMDPEERMLERFAREKQKRTRNSSMYNLEENVQLTHFGQSLAELDDFDRSELIGVSDDDGDIREDVVRQNHFGGDFEENTEAAPERQKTKAEVMAEVISKSKMYKHERQQQHDEDIEEIDALDAEMDELQSVLRSIKRTTLERLAKTQEMMSYDAALREMVYDKRSKPTERTKTEEEVAEEEMEKLQKLERERLQRMRGEEVDTGEEPPKRGSRREGDDLEDDFIPDEGDEDVYGFGKGATGDDLDIENVEDEDDDEINEEMDEEEEEDDDEGSGDDDEFDLAEFFTDEDVDDRQLEESEQEDDITPATKRLRIAEQSLTTTELAYTFPCPASFEEMIDILKNVPITSIPTVIERIEILHSIKLRAENREKLEVPCPLKVLLIKTFTPIVLKVILQLAEEDATPFDVISAILVRLHGLATQFPSALTQDVFTAIEAGRKHLTLSLSTDRVFPSAQDLVLFYVVGQIYPTSDLSHIVVNPVTLFMAQILSQMKVKSAQDLGRGLFICSLFLQYQSLAKRVCPEVVNFINFTLSTLLPVKGIVGRPETRPSEDTKSLRIRASDIAKDLPEKLSFSALYTTKPNEAQLKFQIFNMVIKLVDISSALWKSVPAFPELFLSTQSILTTISKSKLFSSLPSTAKTPVTTVLETLSRRINLSQRSRVALTLQSHRPIPIPSYLPKYTMSHSFDSKNDPNHERSGLAKLKAQHRREKKSVIREMRKEARTEAVVQSEEGRRKDQLYQEKMRVASGIMRAGNAVGKWERDQKRKRR